MHFAARLPSCRRAKPRGLEDLGRSEHPVTPPTCLCCPAKGLEPGNPLTKPCRTGRPQSTSLPSPCYANEGASHWLGLQHSSEGVCRDSLGGVVVTQTHGPSRLLGCAGCPAAQGTCYLFGERSSIRPRTLPHSPLFPGTARFFSQRSNFCIPVSPESWGPEAVLSLGAVPWQRRFLSEPDFCSWAGLHHPHHTLRREEPAPFQPRLPAQSRPPPPSAVPLPATACYPSSPSALQYFLSASLLSSICFVFPTL